MSDELKRLEQKIDELIQMQKVSTHNIYALYRRTTALAHMLEATSEGKEPRLPKTLRAEIDASLNPEWFVQLAEQDKSEFVRRYGDEVFDLLMQHGVGVISKMQDFAPGKSEGVTH